MNENTKTFTVDKYIKYYINTELVDNLNNDHPLVKNNFANIADFSLEYNEYLIGEPYNIYFTMTSYSNELLHIRKINDDFYCKII